MFYPLHDMEIYRSYRHGTYDASNSVSARGISLPTYFEMTEAQVDKVCSVIAGSARK
jgi:dTDP-4-amino-4,6-dideoxygalactose transaminase